MDNTLKAPHWQVARLIKSFLALASLAVVLGLNPIQAIGAERHFNLGSFTPPAGATFDQLVGPGTFLDIYSFEFLSADSTRGVIGASLGTFGLSDVMVGLWSNGTEIAATQMFASASAYFSAYVDLPVNSIYELRVSGTAGDHGGAYTGAFGMLAVAPVPEPEVYAMMAVGIAVLGWAGRRRKQKLLDAV